MDSMASLFCAAISLLAHWGATENYDSEHSISFASFFDNFDQWLEDQSAEVDVQGKKYLARITRNEDAAKESRRKNYLKLSEEFGND